VNTLDGQVALVTGAAGGIGAAIATRLANDGAHVVVADLDAGRAQARAQEIRQTGASAESLGLDVSDVDAVRAAVDGIVTSRGALEILVNNAGIAISKPLVDYTPADYELQLGVNLRGPFFLLQAAARHMIARGSGRIVNVASTAGFVASSTPEALYDVSKAGIRHLTVVAAAELAVHGINVNGVAPGTIATPLTAAVLDDDAKRARAAEMIPAGRVGEPADIAGAVRWLVSPDASYVHGHVVAVDGGWLLH
jgi:NAD(P)-dependent dehydrogenase (short-subunit alcohol dehydrogenase family)